jgi:capsular exopolysaccharide synthesis family protein
MQKINIENIEKHDFRVNEAYKQLRTNIQFCGQDIKVIAITSTLSNEGKSSVSFNLAVSMAEAGKKVIFLDTDLRKSVLIGRHRINQSIKGMTHFLTGISKIDEVLYATNVPNLHVIFSGPVPPNPAELLGKDLFDQLLVQLREYYDYIIIDTPPLGSVIDAAIVAEKSDGVAMVITYGEINHKLASETVEQLKRTNCTILGAILNKVDERKSGYYGYYYGKYYGKYYEHDDK